ncbi:MAG TPA: hypothetical protein VFV33_16760, partial [Gemmatimonadaceae bacterium]|nr:hypothetical protein [Gemmatimonadaceae bacterium]
MVPVSTILSLGSLVAATACGGGRPGPVVRPSPPDAAPTALARADQQQSAAGVLARFAAQKLIVLPAQGVLAADPLGWRTSSGGDRVLLASLDAGLEAALGERGLGSQWSFPPALQRAARRNPTYV